MLAVLVGHAQTLTIKDKETNEPLELVTLFSELNKAYTITNAQGKADISAFKNAETIQIRTLGYQSIITSYQKLKELGYIVLMEPSNLNLDELVVSATRWRQMSSEVPAKIISISSKEVQLQNPQTAADLLGVSGKVYIQKSQQGGGSPMIRGFATNRLIYTVDGVRMNTAIFRGGNIQNVINIDPFATENTEVFFGPGSVIYGSDAIGGVMSFQTLTPQLSLEDKPLIKGKAVTRYSSANNERTGHVDVNVGWKKWALVTSISSWNYDHLRQGQFGPTDYLKPTHIERIDGIDRVVTQEDELLQIPSAYDQLNLMQKVRFKPNEKWDFQYGFHHSETSPFGRYDRHNRIRNGLPRYGEWNYGAQSWMMNNLNITNTTNAILYDQMTIRLAQQSFAESRISRDLNDAFREIREENVEAYSANLDFVKTVGKRHNLYYGAEYVRNEVTSIGVQELIFTELRAPGPSRYPDANWQSLGVYVNDEFDVSERFTLQGGMRYNQFMLDAAFDTTFYPFPFTEANINNGAFTGSLGAVYRPNDTWVISTNFGTAFRSPNVDDIGKVFDSEPGAVTVPNPNLSAEYAYNLDVSVAKIIADVVKLDVTGYYTILENALVRRDFTLNGKDSILYDGIMSQVQAIQNAAQAKVYGLQAGMEVKFPGGFGFSSDLNIQVGEEELDDGTVSPSRHAAPAFGVSRLTYRYKKLNLQLYAVYQDERTHNELSVEERGKNEIYALDANGNTYAPAWYTLNFKAMIPVTQSFTITGGVENITDQRYRPYSSGISGPGRNFVLSVQANF